MRHADRHRATTSAFDLDDDVVDVIVDVLQPQTLRRLRLKAVHGARDSLRVPHPAQVELTPAGPRITLDVLGALLPTEQATGRVAALSRRLDTIHASVVTRGAGDYCQIFACSMAQASAEFDGLALAALYVQPNADPAPLLWARGTCGARDGLDTPQILAWLERWRARCGLRVIGAGGDWLELDVDPLPDDLGAFADAACALCPTVLEQALVAVPPDDSDDVLACMGDALSGQTPADLAEVVARTGRLFLWWS